MNKFRAHVGPDGAVIFPEEFARRYGLEPGTQVSVEETTKGPGLRLPVTHLNKV